MSLSSALTTGAILGMTLASLVNAVPSVTVVPLDSSCSTYPGYDASTGLSETLLVSVNSSGSDIDGHYQVSLTGYRAAGVILGYITIPVDNSFAKTPFRCSNGTLQSYNTGSNANSAEWQPLLAGTSDTQSAALGFGFAGTNSPVLPYAHYVDDVDQGGIFIGAEGTTTWAFSYDDLGEMYNIRLLGPDNAELQDGEVDGFLRVESS